MKPRIIGILILIALGLGSCIYAIDKCGIGALSYKNPAIAAATGQCK